MQADIVKFRSEEQIWVCSGLPYAYIVTLCIVSCTSVQLQGLIKMKYLISISWVLFWCMSSSTLAQETDLEQKNILARDNIPLSETGEDIIKNLNPTSEGQNSSQNVESKPDSIYQATEQTDKKKLKVYITDEFYVPVRSLPDTNGRVIHRGLKSGTPLQVMEGDDGWSRIKTESDLEGWIQTRYITADPIAKALLILAEQKNEQLKSRNKDLERVLKAGEPMKETTRQKLAALSLENERLVAQLEDSASITPSSKAMQDQIQSLVSQNNLLTQENDVLKARLSNLEKDDLYRSFLYGGIAVFLGTILAALIPRLKGRRRFEGWV